MLATPPTLIRTDTSDLTLASTDKYLFPVHQKPLMAHSSEFATVLSHLTPPESPSATTNPVVLLPYTHEVIAFVLPYMYDGTLPDIISLKFHRMWTILEMAMKYKVTRALDSFEAACKRHSHHPEFGDKILAYLVAVFLKRHNLMNSCLKQVLYQNAHPKTLIVALSKLTESGAIPQHAASPLRTLYILSKTRHTKLAALHRTLYKTFKASTDAHHARHEGDSEKNCTCHRSDELDVWWQHACQATQHHLKAIYATFVATKEFDNRCDEEMKKALKELCIKSAEVDVIRSK